MGFDKELEIDVGRWVRAVLQKWWLIVITTLCCFSVTFLLVQRRPAVYTAKAVVCSYASMDYEEEAEILYYLREYAAVGGESIAERAQMFLGDFELTVDEILDMVSYDHEEGKVTMEITASSEDSKVAIEVANAVAESFVIEAQSTTKSDSYKVLAKASLEESGVSELAICILGALLGFILPVIIIVLKQMLSDKIYYVSDAALGDKLEIIGVIPEQTKL